MTSEIRPVETGRGRSNGAVSGRKGVAVTRERTSEIGDNGVTLPIGDCEKFRGHHVERRSLCKGKASGIAVIAATQFEGRLDQEAASVVADSAEWSGGGGRPRARRRAEHGAGH